MSRAAGAPMIVETIAPPLVAGVRIVIGASAVALVAGIAMLAIDADDLGVAALLCIALGGMALAVSALLVVQWTSRIVVDERSVRIEPVLLRPHLVARADVARIVVALVDQPSARSREVATRFVLVGADGRCIARATWPTDPAWWRIPAAVDVPLDERGEVPARDLERDVPGSTRWVERWERWLLLMGIGPIVVAGIVVVVVIGALTR